MADNRTDQTALNNTNSCILDSGTTHSILKLRDYFHQITPSHRQLTTIMGQHQLEEGHGPATLVLPRGTLIHMKAAIYAPRATRNLLSFKDIRANALHIRTDIQNGSEVLHILKETQAGMEILESLIAYPQGFYITRAHSFHTETSSNSITETWHRRLGHPGTSMFQKILKSTKGIPPTVHPSAMRGPCLACSEGKLILRPAPATTEAKIPNFMERLHADVCGSIEPASGPFRFFLAVIDASSKWSQVSSCPHKI